LTTVLDFFLFCSFLSSAFFFFSLSFLFSFNLFLLFSRRTTDNVTKRINKTATIIALVGPKVPITAPVILEKTPFFFPWPGFSSALISPGSPFSSDLGSGTPQDLDSSGLPLLALHPVSSLEHSLV